MQALDLRPFTSSGTRSGLIRLLLLWQMPLHGKVRADEDIRVTVERDRRRLLAARGIAGAEIVRLERAGDLHPLWYDWMLVVDVLADDPQSQRPLDDLCEDLRSLNAHPVLLRCADPQLRE